MNEFFSRVYRRPLKHRREEEKRQEWGWRGGIRSIESLYSRDDNGEKKERKRERKKRREEKKAKGMFPRSAAGRTDLVCTGSRKLFAGAPLPSRAYKWGFIGGMRVWIRVNGWFMLYNLFSIEEWCVRERCIGWGLFQAVVRRPDVAWLVSAAFRIYGEAREQYMSSK